MSWNIAVASQDKAKAKSCVQGKSRVPKFVRDAICAAIDQLPDDTPFIVDSAGHIDNNGGNAKFNVRTYETSIS
jgi:hypothetical protein